MTLAQQLSCTNAYGFGRARRVVRNLDLIEQRTTRIAALVSTGMDPLAAMLKFDFEEAPVTTNAKQLHRIGMPCPFAAHGVTIHDDMGRLAATWSSTVVRSLLIETIESLADLGIYLVRTNSYTDISLLVYLWGRVLRDEVRDLPPGTAAEFIDLDHRNEGKATLIDRDRWLPKP